MFKCVCVCMNVCLMWYGYTWDQKTVSDSLKSQRVVSGQTGVLVPKLRSSKRTNSALNHLSLSSSQKAHILTH